MTRRTLGLFIAWREHTLDEVRHAAGMAYTPHR
jgi:hypothetical protein